MQQQATRSPTFADRSIPVGSGTSPTKEQFAGVLNHDDLSTGNPLPPQSDPLARALDRLWSRGLTVVVAAGDETVVFTGDAVDLRRVADWVDPKNGVSVPCGWSIRCESRDGLVELEVDGYARGGWPCH